MSVKMIGLVWDCDLPRGEKYILLSLADHASHDGRNIYPSIDYTAWKTGYERRSVQRKIRRLEDKGILVKVAEHTHNFPNEYAIDVSALPMREPYNRGGKMSPQGWQNVTQTVSRNIVSKDTNEPQQPQLLADIAPPEKEKEEKSRRTQLAKEMVGVLCEVTNEDPDLRFKRWIKFAYKLVDKGVSPERIKSLYGKGGWWYEHDWRGQQNDKPNQGTIQETLKEALESKDVKKLDVTVEERKPLTTIH